MNIPAPPSPSAEKLSEELFQVRHHALIRAILDNISEGVSITDTAGNFIYVSAFTRKVFGGSDDNEARPEEWTERHGIFRPDGQTPLPVEEMPVWRALKGEEVRDVDMFVRNAGFPQGLHVRTHCLPVRDEQGHLLGAMVLVQDIDEQRRSEEEHRRTEQHFRLLIETAQEGIWTIDPEERTTYVNRYMAELLGYSPEEMQGRPLFDFMDKEDQPSASEDLTEQSKGTRTTMHRDRKFVRKDGTTLWTRLSGSPMFDAQGRYTGSLAMITDITQRREAEEQVRQLNAQLEHRITERTAQLEFSNRELESFSYSVAHDLRAPLRSIASFSDALVEDCTDQLDDTGKDYLRRITGAAKRMAALIDGLLALSRVNSTELKDRECDLSLKAHAVLEQLQEQQPERTVNARIQEGLRARGDPELLLAVLENLLGNAWKFTRERPVAEIEFSATQDASGRPTYVVRDNGAGFNMAYRDKLFGVFQRLHTQREFEGTGIGLATVQRILRRHGGRIWGEGQPGQGASFFFTLNEFPLPPRTTPLDREN
jgi:PAS domain S-box-containing protein